MSNLLDLLISGLATGAIYAIVAVGFTLLWQTSQTINFAQGEFVMLPAFLMLAAMHAGVPFWLAVVIGMLASMLLLGLGFKMLLVDPMLRHGVLPLAIATMALAIGIKEAVKQFFSAEASPFPSIVPAGDISVWIIVAPALVSSSALRLRVSAQDDGRASEAASPDSDEIVGVAASAPTRPSRPRDRQDRAMPAHLIRCHLGLGYGRHRPSICTAIPTRRSIGAWPKATEV